MIKHTVIELFKALSNDELKKFSNFLNSRYFNNSSKVKLLFRQLIKHYPSFTNNLNKVSLYKEIYGEVPYNDSTFRNHFSQLEKLIEKFLKVENMNRNHIKNEFNLLGELRERNLYDI